MKLLCANSTGEPGSQTSRSSVLIRRRSWVRACDRMRVTDLGRATASPDRARPARDITALLHKFELLPLYVHDVARRESTDSAWAPTIQFSHENCPEYVRSPRSGQNPFVEAHRQTRFLQCKYAFPQDHKPCRLRGQHTVD